MSDLDLIQSELSAARTSTHARLDAILRELDQQRQDARQRHEENSERLDRIEDQVDRTNGRTTRNEEQIKALQSDQVGFRRQLHDFREKLMLLQPLRSIKGDLKLAISMVIGTATLTAAVVLWILRVTGHP